MIDKLIVLFYNSYTYIKKHPQLLMTLLLIIIIPIAFVVSGQQFLNAAKENQEKLEKERIGLLHDLFVSLSIVAEFDQKTIERVIQNITMQNPDIIEFELAQDSDGQIEIVASKNSDVMGKTVEDPFSYRVANVSPNESIITPSISEGVRYWNSYRLIQTESEELYYLYTKTSLEHIDRLFVTRITTAYYWLFGILAVVLLLVLRHVRLIDYAYLYQETKRANEMRDLFTNMISHELRAPLTVIRGYASMLKEDSHSPDKTYVHATRIDDSAIRLITIVNDLLDVARIQSGKLSISKTKTNIQSVINNVLEGMQGPAKEKNIELLRDGTRGDVFIVTDEKRLYQAFTNLVSNAIKYTRAGTISIGVEERGDRIEIRVKDTGMGISASDQKNLFAPFFRVGTKEVNIISGTGLGMWITKQLIELLGGSVGVESIKGVGTHIVVTLPKK